ncbi:hypothetical protein QNH10_06390 [Sporosarcina thermotolerans]|uniref:hypothetical protein n=1 Tax=Sporosarcina thermotolerans TaxID=633404 RepID=UPI0024BD1689|nr:hypothetical protein [Sporosarcina thermotolerans]WHT49243.1 hypothetical protein QNH10_06390 [Sporosarcina thermotolerans]
MKGLIIVFEQYKRGLNTNSNTNNPGENRTQELAEDFDVKGDIYDTPLKREKEK